MFLEESTSDPPGVLDLNFDSEPMR